MGLKDLEAMQARKVYLNVWHKDLMSTMTANPGYCCFACFCPYCASFSLRKRALYNDMSRYRCCGGYMPCSGKCGEKHCPTCCLCCEVVCCFGPSVTSTRFLIQDEFNIKTTGCDNCIIGCMFCLKQVSCICSLIACLTCCSEINDLAECLSCISETVYCSVCACMQTQHKIELNKRDGKYDNPQPVMAAPQVQQMSRGVDPSTTQGYPPQGSPPMGYQPPPMGYPHQPPGYMHPPAYGQPGGHDPYAPVAYHPQDPQYPPHMYQPHAPYVPGHPPGLYAQGPNSGFIPGPESGPYPPSRPPPPPPGYHAEAPSAPPPPQEHFQTDPPSQNPPK